MDKKAQTGPIALIFLVIVFLINWFIWLGDFINTIGKQAVIDNSLTGIEAFLFSNLNIIIFIVVLTCIIGWGYLTT